MPMPNIASPATHLVSRSANRSRSGRAEMGEVSPGMEFHRTEVVGAPTGLLVPVMAAAAARYEGEVRELVHGLKYGGKAGIAAVLAKMIVDESAPLRGRLHGTGTVVVTWAPTTGRRRRTRGYDQAELIARHVAAYVELRHRSLLRRTSHGHQTGATRPARLQGPSFVARPMRPCSVIVVDDVMTTGATLRAAAQAIVAAGAREVMCVAAARTPERSGVAERDTSGLGDGSGRVLAHVNAVQAEGARGHDVRLEVVEKRRT
jgi:predicted amidophosphoribosyltransferase